MQQFLSCFRCGWDKFLVGFVGIRVGQADEEGGRLEQVVGWWGGRVFWSFFGGWGWDYWVVRFFFLEVYLFIFIFVSGEFLVFVVFFRGFLFRIQRSDGFRKGSLRIVLFVFVCMRVCLCLWVWLLFVFFYQWQSYFLGFYMLVR